MIFPFPGKKKLIYLITKGSLTRENYHLGSQETLKIIEKAVESRIHLIQIREKLLPVKMVFDLLCSALKIAENTDTKILANDRIDIALAANAHGVHLTSKSLPTNKVRAAVPENFLIGVSTHTHRDAARAKDEGADFATFSHIFPTASKSDSCNPKGLNELQRVCRALSPFPIVALGGISETNYESVLDNGARGFAAITFLNNSRTLGEIGRIFN